MWNFFETPSNLILDSFWYPQKNTFNQNESMSKNNGIKW